MLVKGEVGSFSRKIQLNRPNKKNRAKIYKKKKDADYRRARKSVVESDSE